jgi:hypothetical protein
MQAELITAQTQKQERQAQIEPLQEWVAEVLAGRRSQNTDSTDSARMRRTDERGSGSADSRHHQGENHTGTDTSNRIAGKVPDDHQGDRGSTEQLGDSG